MRERLDTDPAWPRVIALTHPPCTACGAVVGHHRGCQFDEPTMVEFDDGLDDTLDDDGDGPEAA